MRLGASLLDYNILKTNASSLTELTETNRRQEENDWDNQRKELGVLYSALGTAESFCTVCWHVPLAVIGTCFIMISCRR